MFSVALLFPGQGAQTVGMGRDLYEQFPVAKELFLRANAFLGFDVAQLCFEGPADRLTRTEFCQPALYVTSLAVWAALQSGLTTAFRPAAVARARPGAMKPGRAIGCPAGTPFGRRTTSPRLALPVRQAGGRQASWVAAAAGLSLGEYTALTVAGALSFEEGLRVVYLRGQAMEEASRLTPGTMASVVGLEGSILEAICAETGAQIATINSPGQLVISGSLVAVQAASEKAKARGAKWVIPLEVGGAFHSRLMEPAAARLKGALEGLSVQKFQFPVVSNVTGSSYTAPGEVSKLLLDQLTQPVQWVACMQALLTGGIHTFLELGPGTVLKGLARKINPAAVVLSVGSADQVREVVEKWAAQEV